MKRPATNLGQTMANLLLMRGTSIGLVTNVNELQLGIDVEKRPPGATESSHHFIHLARADLRDGLG